MTVAEGSPIDFTNIDYSSEKGQKAYISAIFANRNVNLENGTGYLWNDHLSRHVQTFFVESGCGPETKLGQLVQVIVCERRQEIGLGNNQTDSDAGISFKMQSTLSRVQKLREIMAIEIFGEHLAEIYTRRIKKDYIIGSKAGNSTQRQKGRMKALRGIVVDIKENFPDTIR